MKNILSIILLSLFISVASAQTPMRATIPAAAGGAVSGATTATSGGVTAVYLYASAKALPYRYATFQVVSTRVSTGQNGNAFLQGSVDGINYFALSTTDSIHISNAAVDPGDKVISIGPTSTAYPNNGVIYNYYRLKFVQIAGDTATVSAYSKFTQ